MESKKAIRAEILKARLALTPAVRQELTDRITARLLAEPVYRQARNIYCYLDFKGEVGTEALVAHSLAAGKRVYAPVTGTTDLTFYRLQQVGDTRPGVWGIREPAGRERPAAADGLVIVPGLAFDPEGYRVGYGRGYYDRFLRAHPQLAAVGLAFELQLRSRVPRGPGDVALAMVLTETRTIIKKDAQA